MNLDPVNLIGQTPTLPVLSLGISENWPATPDWSDAVLEEIAFRTEIIRSRDGTEQRRAERVNPRYAYRWTSLIQRDNFRAVERHLFTRQARELFFEHPRKTILTDRGHPAAAGFFGRLDGAVSLGAITDQVGRVETRVKVNPTTYLIGLSYGSAATLYRSREVFPLKPNWAGGVRLGFEQAVENFDFERGATDYFTPEDFTSRMVEMGFLIRDQAQEEALIGCFYRAKGRQKEFYAEDPTTQIVPVLPIASGATSITLAGTFTYHALRDDLMYRNIVIRANGTTYYRRVSGITRSGQNTVINLTESLPAITEANFVGASWLLRCRFENDTLSLNWITDTVARCVVTLRALEDA